MAENALFQHKPSFVRPNTLTFIMLNNIKHSKKNNKTFFTVILQMVVVKKILIQIAGTYLTLQTFMLKTLFSKLDFKQREITF